MLSFLAALLVTIAHADDVPSCAAAFAQRPDRASVESALACYAAHGDSSFASREGQLKALTYAITHYHAAADHDDQRNWIDQGLTTATALETAATDNAARGAAKYWKGSFITFDAQLQDGLPIGEEPRAISTIPFHTMAALSEITALFNDAVRLNRSYHGCGAQRNLGIMHLSQPELFFPGSTQLAIRALSAAYSCDQWFSLNVLYLARALRKGNRAADALPTLTWFIGAATTHPESFGADRLPETREDLAAAQRLLSTL